jgi:hypothetical protein
MVEALFLKVFERFGWRVERVAQLEWTIARYLAGSFQRKLPFMNSTLRDLENASLLC